MVSFHALDLDLEQLKQNELANLLTQDRRKKFGLQVVWWP